MKVSRVSAAMVVSGSAFHSLMVLGRNDSVLYSCLPRILTSCCECARLGLMGAGLIFFMLKMASWSKNFFNIASLLILRLCWRLGHWRASIMQVTLDVLWYLLTTNLAARLCTASSLSICSYVYGSQTVHAYSRMGLTNVLYAMSFTFCDPIFKFLRRKPRVLFAFLQTLSM